MVKKQLIMEKASELFAEQGFKATSVQQITEHCGISKGAFYLSFDSKDQLILAIIDHFMSQVTVSCDYIVKHSNKDELLYEFYRETYQFFYKHANIAKIFIKETQTFNEELIGKMRYYNQLHEKIILTMIDRLYDEGIKELKYDLLYCIKNFMNMYAEIVLLDEIKLDIDMLSTSLVEKTNLLANNITIPLITEQQYKVGKYKNGTEITNKELIEVLEHNSKEVEGEIEKESILLLQTNLKETNLSMPIVKGLIENIRYHPGCEWTAYLLRQYYGL